jgi:Tol biopolymer transport system component/tRNA A-37 threonylcarbamoyl transferase component Bud32
MGEVYRARDTRLERTVAIKVLPQQFASDPQLRERFDREARTISRLSHPHICTLHDVGRLRVSDASASQGDDVDFLVMECLEGETLAARIERGPLKLDEALRIGAQILSALDAAHSAGVVHRDLKPGNVMLAKSGAGSSAPQAKLLDFGLAKQSTSPVVDTLTMMPTTPATLTAQGTILGTFHYMAPEQLEGADADARTDIHAFGCVLYEMLTGTKAFSGKSQASLISAIMSGTPPVLSALVPQAPPALDRVVRTALAKHPGDRFISAHDLMLQLRWIAEDGDTCAAGAMAPERTSRRREWLAWTVAGVMAALALVAVLRSARQPREQAVAPVQFTLPLSGNAAFSGTAPRLAVSPDGRVVAVVASSLGFGGGGIWVRPLDSAEFKPIRGTELASYPFWSPDSRSIAFFAGGQLKKVGAAGGPVSVVCDALGTNLGVAWSPANVIVFGAAPGSGGLQRVPAAGGTPTPLTTPDAALGETDHRWPTMLPDGRHVLFLAVGKRGTSLRVASLESSDVATIGPVESSVGYSSGYLLSMRQGSLMAQPFDATSRSLGGEPVAIAADVGADQGLFTSFSASSNGVLAYGQRSGGLRSRLTWLDRSGRSIGTIGDAEEYLSFSLSPDNTRVVAALTTAANRDVWTIDASRWVKTRLTFDPGVDVNPIWSPDGRRVVFTGNAQGTGLYIKNADGNDTPQRILQMDGISSPMDWSRDGRYIIFWNVAAKTSGDLWLVPVGGSEKPTAFAQTPSTEQDGRFSPDMRWVAYASNESGRMEVYAQPFPQTGAKYRLSRDGGQSPQWSSDGKELYFLSPDATMMAVSIETARDLTAGIPRELFSADGVSVNGRQLFSVTPDGQRFLVSITETPGSLSVVLNWPSLIPR